jgi:hypothetical protein
VRATPGSVLVFWCGLAWDSTLSHTPPRHLPLNSRFFFLECLADNVNIMDNAFEGNQGLGIVINEGVQVRVQGNVFESLGGPAIFARAVAALIITSNYFEANNIDPSPQVVLPLSPPGPFRCSPRSL